MKVKKIFHLFGKILGPVKGTRFFLLFAAGFLLSLAPLALAQDTQGSDLSSMLKQAPAEKQLTTESVGHQPGGFLDRFHLLDWGADNEGPVLDNKIRTVSLYPQSFYASKPVAYQTAPVRSYFLLIDPNKESTYVGLANIDTEEKTELKGIYQKDTNAELLLGYRWAGFGSILFGRAFQYERLGEDVGRVNDMGWRLKFLKTF